MIREAGRAIAGRRTWLAVGLLACSTCVLAQGSQDFLRNTFSTNSDNRFWAEVRQRDENLKRMQSQYQDSMASAWHQEAVAKQMTPQRVRYEKLLAQIEAKEPFDLADMTEAGFNLYFGEGLPKIPKRGLKILEYAAGDNPEGNVFSYAQVILGDIYWNGQEMKADKRKGLEWYRKAAERGNLVALQNLIAILLGGEGKVIPVDLTEAARWADSLEELLHAPWTSRNAASGKDAPGVYFANDADRASAAMLVSVAAMLGRGDRARSLYWLDRAAKWGCAECARMIGEFGYSSNGLPTGWTELELTVLRTKLTVPPYRGRWASGPFVWDGRTTQGLRLDGGPAVGRWAMAVDDGSGSCIESMGRAQLEGGMQPLPITALTGGTAPADPTNQNWYPNALADSDGGFVLCRASAKGRMQVDVFAADEGVVRPDLKLLFSELLPVLESVATALPH